jgi:hypothetical protein
MTSRERVEEARRRVSDAERLARAALENLDKATARLAALENEPDEPKGGSIVRFDVQFLPDGTSYTYVALRAPDGKWYRTGSAKPLSWSDLIGFMYQDDTTQKQGVRFFLMNGKKGRWVGRGID